MESKIKISLIFDIKMISNFDDDFYIDERIGI